VTDPATDTIRSATADGVAVITFNRPERHNAMDNPMSAAFGAAVSAALEDPAVRAILLRGEGKSFSTGRDTAALGKRAPGVSDFAHVSRSQQRKFQFLDSQKPTIAAVRGYAIGGGCEIALQCDLRVASETAQFSLPEIDHGIITDGGGSVITAALAGPSRAKYLLMTGERIDAAQALAWGLVDFVVPDDELDDKAMAVARKIAARPPIHVAVAKQLIDGLYGEGIRRGIREELLAISLLYKTEDRQEARAARAEKRSPSFRGL
jgi:enoyl-CoA hydratase/carnithine racemase